MTNEQRRHERVPLVVEVHWDGGTRSTAARTGDISEGGCFVDSVVHAPIGEALNFKLLLPDGEWLVVQGQVVYELPGTGFGVQFLNLTESDRERLRALLKTDESQ